MDLTPILDRLKTQMTGFRLVGSAVDLDALADGAVPVTPAAYLIPLGEDGGDNTLTGDLQLLTVDFAVILTLANRRDASGAAAIGELESWRAKVRDALLGWTPDAETCSSPRFSGGRVLHFGDGVLWWSDEYQVSTCLQY